MNSMSRLTARRLERKQAKITDAGTTLTDDNVTPWARLKARRFLERCARPRFMPSVGLGRQERRADAARKRHEPGDKVRRAVNANKKARA